MNTADHIHARLVSLKPLVCELVDESGQHAGHAGAASGGHYHLTIVSDCFTGIPPLARHRLVFGTLGSLPDLGIHALSIKALAPEEAAGQQG